MKENEMYKLLETAQATYGYANQVVVAIEELCELGAVLSKYPRYNFHDDAMKAIRDDVVEETADVIIMLNHIQMIFGIQPAELDSMIDRKLNRLKRWLENDDKSFQHTTEDREVGYQSCEHCYYWEQIADNSPCKDCVEYDKYSPVNTEVCDEPK